MNTQHRFKLRLYLLAFLLTLTLSPACTPAPTPTPFIPPKAPTPTQALVEGNTPVIPTYTPQPVPTSSPTPTPPCTDSLAFVEDLTVPDGTVVSPGASVDKGWLVQNNGSCNWDSRYRLRFVGGSEMGAATERALYPARAGSQASIRISFTAPSEPGTYNTAWQAIDPFGDPFGDPVFMEIIVQAELQVTLEIIETVSP
ncbi:MAG: NBR1-Ig-like domain-containing protein [Anaerolineales bacterium]